MKQTTITANVTEKTRLNARRKALDAGKSLRVFAGEILEAAIGKTKRKVESK